MGLNNFHKGYNMKNKLINFSKNIFKGMKLSLKELLITLLIVSIFISILFGWTCFIGFIAMLITQAKPFTIDNLINFGMASTSIIAFIIIAVWFIGDSVINFVKWIKDCWKNS